MRADFIPYTRTEQDVLETVRDNLLKDRGDLRFGVSKFDAGVAFKVFRKAPCAVCRSSVESAGRLNNIAAVLESLACPMCCLRMRSWTGTSLT